MASLTRRFQRASCRSRGTRWPRPSDALERLSRAGVRWRWVVPGQCWRRVR